MASDDDVLEGLAKDGSMDYAEWPSLLERMLPRLERIAYNSFPTPKIPLPASLPPPIEDDHISTKQEPPSTEERSEEEPTAKEESITIKQEPSETDTQTGVKRNLSSKSDSSPTKRERNNSPTPKQEISPTISTIAAPPNTLPPPLLSLLQTIQTTLSTTFATCPPHTDQRLAELLLHPTLHYRTLPSYLRALDRIVSVASPASAFPLPTINPTLDTNGFMLNGAPSPSPDTAGSDSFIGGAELTEIPWLRNQRLEAGSQSPPVHNTLGPGSDLRTESTSVIDGPNGAGSVETVTVNVNGVSSHTTHSDPGHGITQGDSLRQEQEAGIVPVPSPTHNGRVTRSSAAATAAATRAVVGEDEEGAGVGEDEPVHARGPDVIGMEDMGPQAPGSVLAGGLDLEGALGRRGEGESMASAVGRGGEGGGENGEEKDGHGGGDMVVAVADADADGVVEGEEGADAVGENKGADAMDSTTL